MPIMKRKGGGIILTLTQYLLDPCGAASLPWHKQSTLEVPDTMRIVHHRDFTPELLQDFTDEPYFRLYHDLQSVAIPTLPAGFSVTEASAEEFARHIRQCYDCNISVEEVAGFRSRIVFAPALWISVRNDATDQIVASGIAELDCSIGEGTLEWIQVSPAYRNRGLGRFLVLTLLQRLQKDARFVTVSGSCRNKTTPERLYRNCGFTGSDIWHILRTK